jgi:hypothetical protein
MSIHKPPPAQSYMGLLNRPGNGSSCRLNLGNHILFGLLHTHLNLETVIMSGMHLPELMLGA